MKGFFIALEGIDGCGKTTQLTALAEWLPMSGMMPNGAQLIVTREPGGTAFGVSLRNSLLAPEKGKEPCRTAELLLYMADRAQHVETVIKPALEAGNWVLCDRFSASTVAYQGYGRGFSLTDIQMLQEFVSQQIKPDLQLLLDISVDEALKRTRDKQPDRIEAEGKEFLEKVHYGFCGMDVFKIDGSLDVESVTQACKEVIKSCVTRLES